MSTGSADLLEAINTFWDAHGLDWEFKKYWPESKRSRFRSINDIEAPPKQPWPYCVADIGPGNVMSRMSGSGPDQRFETRDVPGNFRIFTNKVADTGMSSKELGKLLAGFVMQKFGGHPTVKPKELVLTNGGVLTTQYVTDHSVRVGDSEQLWNIQYLFRIDVPVAA